MPRPSKRSPELEASILSRLSAGEPLAQICRDDGMPHYATWREWCRSDEKLGIAHAHARDDGFDVIAADAFDILDEEPQRYDTEHGDRVDPAFVQHQKNRFEGRLKLLAKWDPKRYGDATLLKHADADGNNLDLAAQMAAARARTKSE